MALRADAVRVELQEEVEHYQQFVRWRETKGLKTGPEVYHEWKRLLSNRKERARLEAEAHRRVITWLKQNNGTPQEFKAMNERLGHWEQEFYRFGGTPGELP